MTRNSSLSISPNFAPWITWYLEFNFCFRLSQSFWFLRKNSTFRANQWLMSVEGDLFLIKHWDSIKKSHWFFLFPTIEFQNFRGWRRHCGHYLACFFNSNQVCVLLRLCCWTRESFLCVFLLFYCFDSFGWHNRACGLVGERVDPPMTPRSGVWPPACEPWPFYFHFVSFYSFIFAFYFPLWFIFYNLHFYYFVNVLNINPLYLFL